MRLTRKFDGLATRNRFSARQISMFSNQVSADKTENHTTKVQNYAQESSIARDLPEGNSPQQPRFSKSKEMANCC